MTLINLFTKQKQTDRRKTNLQFQKFPPKRKE